MTDECMTLPVTSDDTRAEMLAALKRIESVPARKNIIDVMPDEDWLSEESDTWKIEAGSEKCTNEIDVLDAEQTNAA